MVKEHSEEGGHLRLLTTADVAQRLQVNQKTVRNWIKRGDLKAILYGRLVRIRPSDLDDFIARWRSRSDSRPRIIPYHSKV
jgi:excisionase family DNA binding protein